MTDATQHDDELVRKIEQTTDTSQPTGFEEKVRDCLKDIDLTRLTSEMLDYGKSLPRRDYRTSLTQYSDPRTTHVSSGRCEVTSATSEKPRVGTDELASCAGIAIYDSDAKVGGVAHAFFNEKIGIEKYEKDEWGRDIPSTGRSVIINNPTPFSPFTELAHLLIIQADKLGGSKYTFTTFNVKHGCRTPAQNEQLQRVVDRTIDQLTTTGKISSVQHRNERGFILDTQSGEILPEY